MQSKAVTIKPNEQTDSNKLNDQYRRNAYDIAELYRSYISLSSDITAQMLIQPVAIDAIESQISNLNLILGNLASGRSIISLRDDDNVLFPSSLAIANQCTYQSMFGEAVLPIANTDIEYHFIDPSTGNKVLIQNVQDFVKGYITNNRFKPKIDSLFENAIDNVVDQTTNKGHIARVLTKSSNINDITMVYNLDVEEIRYINSIKVYPLPPLQTSINDVSLVTTNGVRQLVKTVNDKDEVFPITNARKINFRFAPIEITGVSIQINTSNYQTIDNIGTKEFVLGAQLIALEEITYLNEGYVGIKVEVPNGKTVIGKITPIYEGYSENIEVLVYDNLTEFNKVSTANIIGGNVETIQKIINTSITEDYIYILFKLTAQTNNTTPIVQGCVISWL
jgi:hypothetical protein